MTTISIDLETFSDVDIAKCGVYKYAASPNFEILLFGYSIDGGEVQVIDLAQGEKMPEEIIRALVDEKVLKTAYNAVFERVCLSTYIHRNYPALLSTRYIPSTAWKCTLVWAAYCGYPLSLKDAGAALGLEKQKLEEGKELIRYFCVPCNPTKTNGGRTRNLPEHAKEKWDAFVAYNKRDVEVEMQIQEKLSFNPVPETVWEEYHIDQDINDRGILVDMQMVKNAINMDKRSREELTTIMQKITELENPNSVQQLRMWLGAKGMDLESLGKKDVAAVLPHTEGEVRRVLQLRQQLAKSSVKKYHAMENAAGDDNRARGMFQFYGANRTGRFAGRLVQLQNLPQNHLEDLEGARALVRTGNYEALNMLYEDIPDTLSQLIRTAFIPSPGYKYYVADFSAIEARVLSFLAGEQWRIDVFANGGDIYCASASQMFKVPVEKHGVNGHLRQKGKIAELALGYGGSVGALTAMGALAMGLKEDELQPLVDAWRNANPNIVRLWWNVDNMIKQAIKEQTTTKLGSLTFEYAGSHLFIHLPSGRKLAYVNPRMGENRFGGESIHYDGAGATKKWETLESYGPKFVENIIQGISRDILCYAMNTLRDERIVAHVHDELIIECTPDTSLEDICKKMGQTPPWIEGLLLRADGYVTDFYKKD